MKLKRGLGKDKKSTRFFQYHVEPEAEIFIDYIEKCRLFSFPM